MQGDGWVGDLFKQVWIVVIEYRDKVMIVMSDGHANRPDGDGPGYALSMAAYANGLGIKVYTISLGDGADEQASRHTPRSG